MPIPKPNPGEHQDAFIERCMSNEIMVNDFPDEQQRYAVCSSQIGTKSIHEAIQDFLINLKDKK